MRRILPVGSVSTWNIVQIHFLSFVFGVLIISKMLVKWIWDPKSFFILQQRDNPPSCLVDSALGQHKYIKLKGVKFHYVESGSRGQPLVLLLHGFPDCWLSWRHQIPVLSPHFRVVALDLKGYGDSDKPSRRSTYRIAVILEELRQLIVSLGVTSCTVVGHDIGALLGWCLAHQYPEVVSKLVVVSSAHPNVFRTNLHTTSNYHWLNFVQLPYFPEVDALREDVKIISQYHKHLQQSDLYLEAYKYAFCRKEDWTGPLNYFRNMLFVEVAENSNTTLQMPVVLITGNKDQLSKLESIVKSTDYCEKFHVKIIDGAGHFPHQENPKKFNEILLKYLLRKKVVNGLNLEAPPSKGIMNRMLGAVSNTVKYGNSVLDSVQKKTNGVVGNMPSILYSNGYEHSDSN